ncbi:hypothetical protein CPB83DRAFT_890850 [Crepidotus variabilis]|uniref:Protein kinase domain-containing protein n=1 Tax=Crepidotus variabilis TaxID=179855 RepID=A0A9P6JTQ6_9AGAR|nr:hypothetical protein CPB83DRAFT_890850 [Crepidotus variabilis]
MTSSLQLILSNASAPSYTLWSWDHGDFHQVARVCEQLADNICTAYIGPVGETPSHKVVLKIGQGKRADQRLAREYEMYSGPLVHLQGTIVPRCFGLFCGSANESGSGTIKSKKQISCLVLEYIAPHRERTVDPEEFHRQLMLALCKIHKAGINHGNLKTGHILQMGYSPRIIDFSLASRHSCQHGYAAGFCDEDNSQPSSLSPTASELLTCQELRMAEVYHAQDKDGIMKYLERLREKRSVSSSKVPLQKRPHSWPAATFCDVFNPSNIQSITKAPAIYPPPNPNYNHPRNKLRDERLLSQSRTTNRKEQDRTRPPSKIVFGERYPNTSLASRRFSIPTRLDFEPKLKSLTASANASGKTVSMVVPNAQLHADHHAPVRRFLVPPPPCPGKNQNQGNSFYRQLRSLFD